MELVEQAIATPARLAPKAEAILTGALQVFLARGYAAASMDRIAAAAGVSKATVYSHFSDKEGLFAALVARFAEQKYPRLFRQSAPHPPSMSPEILLRQLVNEVLSNIEGDGQHQEFLRLVIGESGRFPELAKIFLRAFTMQGIAVMGAYFASREELNLPDPEATARVFIGAIVYYIITQKLLHGDELIPMERDRLVDTLIHLILSTQRK